jgi:hypothetical protein
MDLYWNTAHAEAMNGTAYLEIPVSSVTPPASTLSGLASENVTLQALLCRELPMQERVKPDQTGYAILPLGLELYDPDRICQANMTLRYNDVRYRIASIIQTTAHDYSVVRLQAIG